MRNLNKTKTALKIMAIAFITAAFMQSTAYAQKDQDEVSSKSELEEIQDQNLDYMKQIHRIIKDYPAFSYTCKMEDGKVTDVEVNGVDNSMDRKKLEVVLFDLKSNRNMIRNKSNRIGIFYSVDKRAEYKRGREALQRELNENLHYPEKAENWGVEGTIYVKFVVDDNGEIPFATTSSDIETPMEAYVKDLEQQAVSAIKATSGDWYAGKVDGVKVASLVVIPVTFDFKKNPSLPALIQ